MVPRRRAGGGAGRHAGVIPVLVALLLAGCSGEPDSGMQPAGLVSVELPGRTIEVAVACQGLAGENFRFLSDATEQHDTNGDGVVVSGVQRGDELMLIVVDRGRSYRAEALSEWRKTAGGASGAGMMLEDGTAAPYGVSFRLECRTSGG